VHREHLPARVFSDGRQTSTGPRSLKVLEAGFIRQELARHRWDRTATAAALGMHRTTLQRKIRDLAIELPALDGRSRQRKPDQE
jgi:DNA-binding NtrC family response regulator